MLCPDRLRKGSVRLLCLVTLLCPGLDGISFDNCATEDGRLGICVARRYCRGIGSDELLECKTSGSYCCPVPSSQRSANRSDSSTPRPSITATQLTDIPHRPTEKPHKRRGSCGSGDPSPRPGSRGRGRTKRDRETYHALNPNLRGTSSRGSSGTVGPDESDWIYFPNDRRSQDTSRPRSFAPEYRTGDAPDSDQSGRNQREWRSQDEHRKAYRDSERSMGHMIRFPGDRPLRLHPGKDVRFNGRPGTRWQDDSRVSGCRETPLNRPGEESGRGRPTSGGEDGPSSPSPDPDRDRAPKVPACGVKPFFLFIAGGEESANHEWPWMVAIIHRGRMMARSSAFVCGGSLINTRFVLTAAHCSVDRRNRIQPASSFVVRLGSNYPDSGEEYSVGDLILHHGYSPTGYTNDIALLRLAGEVFVTDKIAPICLPPPDMWRLDMVGRRATVAGWGDGNTRSSRSGALQHVTIPVVSNQECASAYSRVRGAGFLIRGSDHVICAGLREGGKDACQGDSGGPLMLKLDAERWAIIGIVSLGYNCAEPGYYGVYTRVTHYLSWIREHMNQSH